MVKISFTHTAKDHDVSYNISDTNTSVKIGAMSYTSILNIYDYTSSRPFGSGTGSILIKRFSSIADQVTLQLFGNHNYQKVTTSLLMPLVGDYRAIMEPNPNSENITIGNDCWIGNHVKILSNVNVGDGAVIGANSVVSKNIPPYAIAVGNPIQIIKYRFSKEIIEEMLKIRWWEWSNKKILENSNLLINGDIEKFIDQHRQSNLSD